MKHARARQEEDEDAPLTKLQRQAPPAKPRTPPQSSFRSTGEGGSDVRITCSLPPHKLPISFSTLELYEAHYRQAHTNRCLECHKNFPTAHFLHVHIEDFHDSLIRLRRERAEKTFSCFVEDCDRKFLTHQKRRMHLIDKHMYPADFFFALTKNGIDGRRSLLVESGRSKDPSARGMVSRELELGQCDLEMPQELNQLEPFCAEKSASPILNLQDSDDVAIAHLSNSMSSLQFVPASVRFGRRLGSIAKPSHRYTRVPLHLRDAL